MASKPIDIRWIRTGSVPDLKKSRIVLYYKHFSTNDNIKSKNITLIPVLLVRAFGTWGLTKPRLDFLFYYPQKVVYNTKR